MAKASRPLKDAAIARLGLSQRFRGAVHRELQSGQLQEVLQDFSNLAPGFFIYFPADRHMPLKLRAFIDFMREKREQQVRPSHA